MKACLVYYSAHLDKSWTMTERVQDQYGTPVLKVYWDDRTLGGDAEIMFPGDRIVCETIPDWAEDIC